MRRVDTTFREFRLWWRGASNGRRSGAVATGSAALAFLVWIAVPAGGGVLTTFAARSQGGTGTGPAGTGEGTQLASNPLSLGISSLLSPGTPGVSGGLNFGSGGFDAGSLSGDDGSLSQPPGGSSSPSSPTSPSAPSSPGLPATPASTCPASLPTTNTPLDSLDSELSALCQDLLADVPGVLPAGSLPGAGSAPGASGAQAGVPGAGAPGLPKQWMDMDAPLGASGAPNSTWSRELSAEMAGKDPVVSVGLVQGTAVSSALADMLGELVHDGTLVQLILVPDPAAAGGAPAFASWVSQVLGLLEPLRLVAIGTGSAPSGSSAATVAAYDLAGLVAARHLPSKPTAGIWWLDGGTASGDSAVWSSLESVVAWSQSSFVGRSLEAADACASPAQFATTLRRYPVAAALPLVSEAVQGSVSANALAADSSCLEGSLAGDPSASLALSRLWQGPVPRG